MPIEAHNNSSQNSSSPAGNTAVGSLDSSAFLKLWIPEILAVSVGKITRVFNNNLYLYTGALPFTTVSITTEIETGIWVKILTGSEIAFTQTILDSFALKSELSAAIADLVDSLTVANLSGAGTNRQLFADDDGKITARVGYKVFTALFTCQSDGIPYTTVLENTIAATVTVTNTNGNSTYVVSSGGNHFTAGKTTFHSGSSFNSVNLGSRIVDTESIIFQTYSSGRDHMTPRVYEVFIEVRVYN
jgi:hypothetical protein